MDMAVFTCGISVTSCGQSVSITIGITIVNIFSPGLCIDAADQGIDLLCQVQWDGHKRIGNRIAFGGLDADLCGFRQVGIDPDGQVQVFVVHELVQGFHAAGFSGFDFHIFND